MESMVAGASGDLVLRRERRGSFVLVPPSAAQQPITALIRLASATHLLAVAAGIFVPAWTSTSAVNAASLEHAFDSGLQ
jgi:hypothetical protein